MQSDPDMMSTAPNMPMMDPAMPQMDPEMTVALAAFVMITLLISLVFWVIYAIGLWKMFTKAGQPGILAFIPLVNWFFIVQVAGKPAWWGLLLCIPVVNIVAWILVFIGIAERFGRGIGTVLGLICLRPIFTCILGFGSATWTPDPAQG